MARTRSALTVAVLAGLVTAACSSAAAPAASAPAPAAPTATCTALLAFDASTATYPGGDPDSLPPTADVITAWAATVVGPIGALAAAAPAELAPAVATLRSAVESAQKGTAVDTDDPALTAASTTVDRWARDNCGFTKLDVVGNGTDLASVPATLPAGPLSFTFTNGGAPEKAGFVLLLARVKDGATYTLDGIRDGSVDFTKVADVIGAAQPTAAVPTAYGTASLSAGKYLVVSPVGAPPNFTGVLATEVTVS